MNSELTQAVEGLEQAIERARQNKLYSKQGRFTDAQRFFSSTLSWIRRADLEEPPYRADSRRRDKWLREFWKKEPHLAGVVNSAVAIDKNRSWVMTGGRNQVLRFTRILREAEDGAGWRTFMALQAQSYYTCDLGAVTELGREGRSGPLRALYYVDPARCKLTGDRRHPLEYDDTEKAWAKDDFFRTASLPSTDEGFHGLGYGAVSRALDMAKLMIAIYQHNFEQIGVRAPQGLLLLQNISQDQWEEAMRARDADLDARMQDWFGGVAVLAQMGVDQVDAKLVALSQLPQNFDVKVFTDLLMYSYALCFGYDPMEFWPVQGSTIGRGSESQVQHKKATGKGAADFVLTMQDQLQLQLPDTLKFEFEQRDADGDLTDAEIAYRWSQTIRTLYREGAGVLTREQAASLLVEKNIIPASWTAEIEELAMTTSEQFEDPLDALDADTQTVNGQQTMLDGKWPAEAAQKAAKEKRMLMNKTGRLRRMQEQAAADIAVQRAIDAFPDEPIVRYTWPDNQLITLWEQGRTGKGRTMRW